MNNRASVRINADHIDMQFKKGRQRRLLNASYKALQVKDISKSGVGFLSPTALSSGEMIVMKLHFEDGNVLQLKGQIRWMLPADGEKCYRVGVQFLPFGKQHEYNPISALDYLRNLQSQNLYREPKSDELSN